jgi:hypothetical protein
MSQRGGQDGAPAAFAELIIGRLASAPSCCTDPGARGACGCASFNVLYHYRRRQ